MKTKMKKLLASVIAASVFVAPAFAGSSKPEVYGALKLSYDFIDTDAPVGVGNPDRTLERFSSNSSRFGIKGKKSLVGGMKGVWQLELGVAADMTDVSPGNRNTYVGVSGSFGTVMAGVYDTPYKLSIEPLDVFSDTMGDVNTVMGSISGVNVLDLRVPSLTYISPKLYGMVFAVARGGANERGVQGVSRPSIWSAAGFYESGPLYAVAAWGKHENLNLMPLGPNLGTDLTAWRLGVSYKFGDFKVGAGYEEVKGDPVNDPNINNPVLGRKAWFANGAYRMGSITFKAQYGSVGNLEQTQNTEAQYHAVGVEYALAKDAKVYALYAQTSNSTNATYALGGEGAGGTYDDYASLMGKSPSVFSVGIEYTF